MTNLNFILMDLTLVQGLFMIAFTILILLGCLIVISGFYRRIMANSKTLQSMKKQLQELKTTTKTKKNQNSL